MKAKKKGFVARTTRNACTAFNNAGYVRPNERLAGTTNSCGINIQLNSGEQIGIFGCDEMLEIQRHHTERKVG